MIFPKTLVLAAAAFLSVTTATPIAEPNVSEPSSTALAFSNILVILLENAKFATAIADPNLKAFASSGVLFNNWLAVAHPSQPNYIALTSGSTNGVTSDTSTTINVQNVVDLLEAKGLTWKSYQENWPGNCFLGTSSSDGLYFRKHNPFISYTDIQTNPTRCAKIVPGTQFATDVSQGTTPTFAFYTPNIKNDGHDTGVAFAGTWLNGFLNSTSAKSHFDVVLVLFDENDNSTPNQVYAAIAGRAVTNVGTTDNTALNHFSLLKTLETNFALGNLGKSDVTATAFTL